MADINFIEEAGKLGVEVTQPELEILASEFGIMATNMETTKRIFQLKLADLIASLETRGLSNEQVIAVLLDDFENDGQIFGGLKRSLIGDSQEMLETSSSRITTEEFAKQSGEERGTWVAVLVSTCEDCLPRHGLTKKYSEWEELGLPRSGFSVCRSNCQCEIFPASVVESKAELQEPLKRVKGKITQVAREKKKDGVVKSIPKYVNRKLGSINDTKDPIRKEYRKLLPGFKR